MKKSVKVIGVVTFIIAFFIVVLAGFFNMILWSIGVGVLLIEGIALIVWQIKKIDWKCTQCKTVFSVNWAQSIFGINGGSVKELRCPHCQKKTWCEPVMKQKK